MPPHADFSGVPPHADFSGVPPHADFSGVPPHAEFSGVPPHAEFPGGMAETLESARTLIETRFLDAGEVLSDAVDGIAALVSGLDALTEALSPTTVAATTQQLAAAAARLSAMPGEQTARRAAIGRLQGRREVLSADLQDMRRNLAYMRAFTVSIKITACGIASVNPEFHVFAQEISQRVESGRKEVDGLEVNLGKLKDRLERALHRAETLSQGCAAMIPSVSEQLLSSAAIMAEHHGRTAAAAAQAGTLARDVRKKVTRILGALQIGDSTRQRVEHIQAGIKRMEAEDPAVAPDAASRIRALLGALLAAQLNATLMDFSDSVAEISSGLAGLASDAAALLRLRDLAYGKTDGAGDGFMRALEQRVAEASGLVAEIEEADALARDTGREAAEAAQLLSDRLGAVQTMKTDVLYMALNTTLRAARLGDDGRPLNIIASELRVQAGYLATTAAASMAALTTLIETAAELSRDNGAEGGGPAAALAAAIACIKLAGEKTERDVASLAVQGEAVLKLLNRSAQRLDFQREIGSTLGQVAEDLARLAAHAAPCDEAIEAPLAAHFAELGAIYTMASEREIQAGIAAEWGVNLPAASTHTAAIEADVFEDELF